MATPDVHRAEDPRCSFCGKDQNAVGKLVSNASEYHRVYICEECIAVCAQISQEKEDPFFGNPLLSEFLDSAEQWV